MFTFLAISTTQAWGQYLIARTPVSDTTFVAVIDTESGTLISSASVPSEVSPNSTKAVGIAWVDGDYLLVDDETDRIWTVTEDLQLAAERFATPPFPGGLTAHDGSLFLKVNGSGEQADMIYELDSMTGAVVDSIAVPDSISTIQDLTSDGTYLWAIDTSSPRIWRIDPATGQFEPSAELPGVLSFFFAIAWDPDNQWLWVVESAIDAPRVHTHVPGAGTINLAFSFDDGEEWRFYRSMVFRNDMTPTREMSWGGVKSRFR